MMETAAQVEQAEMVTNPVTACQKTIDLVFGQLEERFTTELQMLIAQGEAPGSLTPPSELALYKREQNMASRSAEMLRQKATHRMCEEASRRAALEFATTYGHIFKRIALIQGCHTNNHPTKDWAQHVVAVAEGVDGRFYGISPANYKALDQVKKANVIFEGNTWDEMIAKVEDLEGCKWPAATDVTDDTFAHTTVTRPDGSTAGVFSQFVTLANETTVNRPVCCFKSGAFLQWERV